MLLGMFTFWTDSRNQRFTCTLKRVRCAYVNADSSAQCPATITVGLPFCAEHLASERRVAIKPSLLVPGQLGLFVHSPGAAEGDIVFRPHDRIIEYVGEDIDAAEVERRYGRGTGSAAPYVLNIGKWFVDAACVRGAAACANGVGRVDDGANAGVHITPANSLANPRRFMLHATKRLRQGQEIILAYGKNYFKPGDTSRHSTSSLSSKHYKIHSVPQKSASQELIPPTSKLNRRK